MSRFDPFGGFDDQFGGFDGQFQRPAGVGSRNGSLLGTGGVTFAQDPYAVDPLAHPAVHQARRDAFLAGAGLQTAPHTAGVYDPMAAAPQRDAGGLDPTQRANFYGSVQKNIAMQQADKLAAKSYHSPVVADVGTPAYKQRLAGTYDAAIKGFEDRNGSLSADPTGAGAAQGLAGVRQQQGTLRQATTAMDPMAQVYQQRADAGQGAIPGIGLDPMTALAGMRDRRGADNAKMAGLEEQAGKLSADVADRQTAPQQMADNTDSISRLKAKRDTLSPTPGIANNSSAPTQPQVAPAPGTDPYEYEMAQANADRQKADIATGGYFTNYDHSQLGLEQHQQAVDANLPDAQSEYLRQGGPVTPQFTQQLLSRVIQLENALTRREAGGERVAAEDVKGQHAEEVAKTKAGATTQSAAARAGATTQAADSRAKATTQSADTRAKATTQAANTSGNYRVEAAQAGGGGKRSNPMMQRFGGGARPTDPSQNPQQAAPAGAGATGAAGAGNQAAPAKPASKAEYDALPTGAVYVNPADGKSYRKK